MPLIKLNEVADVQIGKDFRKAVIDVGSDGNIYVVQINDIPEVSYDPSSITRVLKEPADDKYLLKGNDILMPLRGKYFHAHALDTELTISAIFTSSVARVRCNTDYILPSYLSWYLNTTKVQQHLLSLTEGTKITKVSPKALRQLELNLPDIETQFKIASLYSNVSFQNRLRRKIIELSQIEIDAICNKLQEEAQK